MHIATIIPAFNVAPFLRDTIASLLDQTHTDWSAVVVDDGSTDATADVAMRFQDSRIHLLQQENAGVSAARNAGLAAVRCLDTSHSGWRTGTLPDAVLFLDGDDWLAPEAFTLLAHTLEDAPWAVAACGRYARVAANGARQRGSPSPQGDLLERLLTRNLFANGGHLLIRHDAIEATGDFCTGLSYGEDWEYWSRLALLGEFVSTASAAPLLFVRERQGSAYLSRSTDPEAYRRALNVIYRNRGFATRLGMMRLMTLYHRADAETAWAVGRELIRHGRQRDGQRWLGRSIRDVPSLKRLLLIGVSWLRFGPFRPYRNAGWWLRFSRYRHCD